MSFKHDQNLDGGCSRLVVQEGKLPKVPLPVVLKYLQITNYTQVPSSNKFKKIQDSRVGVPVKNLQQWLSLVGLDESMVDSVVDDIEEVPIGALLNHHLVGSYRLLKHCVNHLKI